MAKEHSWVTEWMEATEELERKAFDVSMSTWAEQAMKLNAALVELSDISKRLREIEDALWRTWK